MKTRQFLVAIVFAVVAGAFAEEPERLLRFRHVNAPLDMVLDDYSRKTGKSIEIVRGVRAVITIQTKEGESVTLAEYCDLIETQLKEANIGLFPISTNRLIATWLEPPKLLRSPVDTPLSAKALEERFQQVQMDHIRQGKPPLPMPLTKEMDDQLVEEGVLPPLENSDEPKADPGTSNNALESDSE